MHKYRVLFAIGLCVFGLANNSLAQSSGAQADAAGTISSEAELEQALRASPGPHVETPAVDRTNSDTQTPGNAVAHPNPGSNTPISCHLYDILLTINNAFRLYVVSAIDWANHGNDRGICTYLGAAKGQVDLLVNLTQNYRGLWPYGRSFQDNLRSAVGFNACTLRFAVTEMRLSLNQALAYCLEPSVSPGSNAAGDRRALLRILGQGAPNSYPYDNHATLGPANDGFAFYHTVTLNSDMLKDYLRIHCCPVRCTA